jgi:hypothetical protein
MNEAFGGPKIVIKDASSKEPMYSETVVPVRTSLDIEQITQNRSTVSDSPVTDLPKKVVWQPNFPTQRREEM